MNSKLCTICGRPDHDPWRLYDERGRVVFGCVDECHTGRLVTPSESARHHNSPVARTLRAALARGRRVPRRKVRP